MTAHDPPSDVAYEFLAAPDVTDAHLRECAALFGGHYGVWSARAGRAAGAPVRMSPRVLRRELLFDADACALVRATVDGALVGHAFLHGHALPPSGDAAPAAVWIAQLVVRADHRRRGVGTRLCRVGIAGVGAGGACGLVSCNPWAVRALEAATGRRCDPARIRRHAARLLAHTRLPYVRGAAPALDDGACLLDTGFFVDQAEPRRALATLADWRLGPLAEGHEFLAFTFGKFCAAPGAARCR